MELVYLWVEDYKNIQKQGFNFSPRFRCEFKDEYDNGKLKDNCELIIDENKDYVSIFPDNIDITAIVGKNGSGKTSLLTLFVGGIFANKKNRKNIKNLFFVYEKDKEFVCYYFFEEEIQITSKKQIINKELYMNIDKSIFNDDFKNNYFLFMDFSIGQLDLWNSSTQEEYKKYYALEPSRNYFSAGPGYNSKIEPTSFAANMKANILYLYKYLDEELINRWKLPKFKKLVYFGMRQMGTPTRDYYKNEIIGKEILGMNFTNAKTYEDVEKTIKDNFENKSEIDFKVIEKKDLNEISILFLFANIEFKTEDGIDFFSMSTGQKQLVSYFGIIIRVIKELINSEKTLTLIIDEIETSLHPQWQKEFISLFIELIESIKTDCKNIQLIMAGHSPFIVSDLPKGNIIFLKNSKQVSGIEKKETFGANIHTLLADSFFVEGGLMGEFAKDKIQSIIKYHENIGKKEISEAEKVEYKTKKQKEFWQIQSIIGDDYLKQVIKNHLIEIEKIVLGNDEAKEEEIKRLKAQIELLEK